MSRAPAPRPVQNRAWDDPSVAVNGLRNVSQSRTAATLALTNFLPASTLPFTYALPAATLALTFAPIPLSPRMIGPASLGRS